MPLEIRAMSEADIPAVRALWTATDGVEVAEGDSPEDLARYLKRNPGTSSVAADSNGIVAAVLCGHDGRRGLVYHLAVKSDYRGRGLGRQVMRRSIAALKQEGIVRALLLVANDNAGGHGFWRREGWEDLSFAQPMGRDL